MYTNTLIRARLVQKCIFTFNVNSLYSSISEACEKIRKWHIYIAKSDNFLTSGYTCRTRTVYRFLRPSKHTYEKWTSYQQLPQSCTRHPPVCASNEECLGNMHGMINSLTAARALNPASVKWEHPAASNSLSSTQEAPSFLRERSVSDSQPDTLSLSRHGQLSHTLPRPTSLTVCRNVHVIKMTIWKQYV